MTDIDQNNPVIAPGAPLPAPSATPWRVPLLPDRFEFLEGEKTAPEKVATFLAGALAATNAAQPIAAALVPWICGALHSNHSVKAYGRDLTDFFRHMEANGVA